MNICVICEKNHNEHERISYSKLIIEDEKIIKKMEEMKKEIDKFNNNIKEKIDKLNKIIKNIEEYYNIINNIINNIIEKYINNKKRNYQIFININNIINKNNIINNIKNINNNNNEYDDIIDIYNKIYNSNIIYKIDENKDKIKIFGKNFVENNKNIIKLEIEGEEYEVIFIY